MTNKVKSVETDNPPRRTLPMPLYNSLPDPVERTKGSNPKILVAALMKMGRILVCTASEIAGIPDMFPNRTLFKER